MPRWNPERIPAYRLHKPSGRAVVTVDGRDIYVGPHGTDESLAQFDRLVQEWLSNGRRLPVERPGESDERMTISELIAAYWEHATRYYVKNGNPTSELARIKSAMKPLRRLYGHTPAAGFGPLALKAVREQMVSDGKARTTTNSHIGIIKRLFRWAVANEHVPADVRHALDAVDGLRRGRCSVRETEPVRPVPEALVQATLPFLSRPVAAMVRLQLLTGMRPGDVVLMRWVDIDVSGQFWTYTPMTHKTEHHGLRRGIQLGPRAQAVLKQFKRPKLEEFIFSPADVVAKLYAERRKQRRSPMTPSQSKRRPKLNPKRRPGQRYTVNSYRVAIRRACDRADQAEKQRPKLACDSERIIPRWHPNQLRHACGTAVRKRFGLEAAQVVLGHTRADVTQVYAERDLELARRVVAEMG